MESAQEIKGNPVKTWMGVNPCMVGLRFHGREPVHIWDKKVLDQLVRDLIAISTTWERIEDGHKQATKPV